MVLTDSTKELLGMITAAQAERSWTDGELSRKLDIAQSQWSRIKSGKRPVSLEFLRAVARVFPALQIKIADYVIKGD